MKTNLTIAEFCDKHHACHEGRQWALAHCKTMQDAWDTAKPEWVLWIATRPGVLTDRDLRLFAVRCARSVPQTDPRSVQALDVAERYAKGEATSEELASANASAWAAMASANASAFVSSRAVAWAAFASANASANASSNASANAVAWATADAVAWATAAFAGFDAFARDLRTLTPNFTITATKEL